MKTNPAYVTQSLTACSSEQEAERILRAEMALEGVIAGRVIRPGKNHGWRTQVFHPDMGADARVYPDGMKRVLLVMNTTNWTVCG